MTEEEIALSMIKVRTIHRASADRIEMLGRFREKLNDVGYVNRVYRILNLMSPNEIKQWEVHSEVSHKTMLKVLRQELVFHEVQQ